MRKTLQFLNYPVYKIFWEDRYESENRESELQHLLRRHDPQSQYNLDITGVVLPHGCVWQTQGPCVQHTAQGYQEK